MKYVFRLWFFFASVAACSAQLNSQAVPDLSAFAEAIAASASAAPAPAPSGRALFNSGLAVPTVTPGAAARRIGAQLRAGLEAKTGPNPAFAQLETGMPGVLASVEGQLEKEGFKRRDLGVAMAYTFLMTYETANRTKVPDEPSRIAARTVARAIAAHWSPVFSKLPDANKEDIYESLLVSTTLISAFSAQFDKAGKTAEAGAMRQSAGQMFEKLLGVPPAQVKIAPDGRISGLTPVHAEAREGAANANSAMSESGTSDVRTSTTAGHPRGSANGETSGIKGIWRADWVTNTYGLGGMQLTAQNVTYSFDDEGDFIAHLPLGKSLGAGDLRAMVASAPNTGGAYEITGDHLLLRYASGTTATFELNRSGGKITGMRGQGHILGRKIIPPDGTRLHRTYGTERITSTGLPSDSATSFVAGSSVITFSPDGRYQYGSTVSLTNQQMTGISRKPQESGQYEIRDGALTLVDGAGKRTTYFIWSEENDFSKIFLNNALYE